jgi:hypothetical protein
MGRQQRAQDSVNEDFVPKSCPKCGSTTHRSTRSSECPFYSKSTKDIIADNLGSEVEYYTRKCSFDVVVKIQYREQLHENVNLLSEYLRAVVIRTQMLVNAFFLSTDGVIPSICFTQNFFYSTMQIVLGHNVTSTNQKIPIAELQSIWSTLKERHPSLAIIPQTSINRTSDVLTEACVNLATAYSNNIVENFCNRMIQYLQYKILADFPVKYGPAT